MGLSFDRGRRSLALATSSGRAEITAGGIALPPAQVSRTVAAANASPQTQRLVKAVRTDDAAHWIPLADAL